MEALTPKSITTSRSLRYTYYASESTISASGSPALFFLHGFPDSAHLWKDIIARLSSLPYRIVAPDLLGYAGTSKPTDPSQYAYSLQAQDLCEILDAEGIRSVILIGHDWGSAMVQRFYLHHRSLVAGIVLLNAAYMVPNPKSKFDLEMVNHSAEQEYGYPLYAYWELFTAEDGPAILKNNLDRFYEVLHGDPPNWMQAQFCVRGAMRSYVLGQDKRVQLKQYALEDGWKRNFFDRFERDGFEAPVRWYKATKENI